MPTSGDLKSGDSLFAFPPPPPTIVTEPSPPNQPSTIGMYEVLREVQTIKICFHHSNLK